MSGTLVLDCEGLSKLVRRSPELTEWLARGRGHPRRHQLAHAAAEGAAEHLRQRARLSWPPILTSDPEDLLMLCGTGTRVIKV
ncbi:hypothetical protein [Streptomyces sp. NK08204]|uniref:hypothetical protein n=1 Tax=Streptomyces sp. NK08204 TaxID=2873260 RepID=UPI001CECF26B|nr:hypothetical protein [Streptomyces sp. NK08204]